MSRLKNLAVALGISALALNGCANRHESPLQSKIKELYLIVETYPALKSQRHVATYTHNNEQYAWICGNIDGKPSLICGMLVDGKRYGVIDIGANGLQEFSISKFKDVVVSPDSTYSYEGLSQKQMLFSKEFYEMLVNKGLDVLKSQKKSVEDWV